MSAVYLTLLTLGALFVAILLHFINTKAGHEDIINYAGKQRMFSQRIALDIAMYSNQGSQHLFRGIESDFTDMKRNTAVLDKFFKGAKVSPDLQAEYWNVRDKLGIYFSSIQNYLGSNGKKGSREIIARSSSILPQLDSIVKNLVQYSKNYNKKILILLLAFFVVSSIAFVLETIFIIIPLIKNYTDNYNRIIDSESKLRLAADSAHLGIWRCNLTTCKVEWDNSMYKIYEIDDLTEIINIERWRNFVCEEFRQELKDIFMKAQEMEQAFSIQFKIITKKGCEKYISSSFMKVNDKTNNLIVIGINSDITDLKKLELEMRQAKESAQMASDAKSEFLANMSHEIRTPLHGIIGLSNMIFETSLSEIQKNYVEMIISSSDLLLQIVNDILDFSKIEAGKLILANEEFSLFHIFDKLSNVFGYTAHTKDLDFRFFISPGIPSRLVGDELRLTQILINLVGNAFKFTKKGSVEVHAKCVEIKNGIVELEFKIVDTGIGIEFDKQSKLFQEFQQGDSTTSKRFGGTGLGLVITKKLIEMMHGGISLKSEVHQGTEFNFNVMIAEGYNPVDHPDLSLPQYSKIFIFSIVGIEIEHLGELLRRQGCQADIIAVRSVLEEIPRIEGADMVIIAWRSYSKKADYIQRVLRACHPHTKVLVLISEYDKHLLNSLLSVEDLDRIQLLSKPLIPSLFYRAVGDKSGTTNFFRPEEEPKPRLVLTDPKSALLVEDNNTNMLIGMNVLEKIGFKVDAATNGLEGVNKVMKSEYDIIFMDIHMPIMDGYEATKKIRNFNNHTPIIGLSASVLDRDRESSQEAGFDYYLGKPILLDELCSTLSNYFEMKYEEDKSLINTDISRMESHYLNMEYFYKTFNDKFLICELFQSFLESFGNIETEWRELPANSNELKEKAHSLKGVVGNFHIDEIYNMVVRFENETDIIAKQKVLESIISAVKGLNEDMKKELGTLK